MKFPEAGDKVKVTLFKPSGKYYTVDEWRVPANVPNGRGGYRAPVIPADMEHSPDFRRIDGGAALVQDGENGVHGWGYEHLFPSVSIASKYVALADQAEGFLGISPLDSYKILRDLIEAIRHEEARVARLGS